MTNEMNFFHKIIALQKSGNPAAVATIIRKKGSTPREIGAKMIIYPNGKIDGTIGGGCGEGEVIDKSFYVIDTGTPTIHQVDLTEGLMYEDGGICGGIMDVFIEPINSQQLKN